MTDWFYSLAVVITLIFIICFVVIFFCSLKIYRNVEETLIKTRRRDKDE